MPFEASEEYLNENRIGKASGFQRFKSAKSAMIVSKHLLQATIFEKVIYFDGRIAIKFVSK